MAKEKKAAKSGAKKESKRMHFVIVAKSAMIDKEKTAAAELLDKKNMTYAAVMYRALVAKDKPMQAADVYGACEGKCESGADYARLGKSVYDTLAKLVKMRVVNKEKLVTAVNSSDDAKPAKKTAKKHSKANGAAKRTEEGSEDASEATATTGATS